MPHQLPLSVFLGWAALFAFVCAQYHHERLIKTSQISSSNLLLRMVEVSNLLGFLFGIGILIYYFVEVTWYWPLVLALLGSMVGAVIAGLLFGLVGEETLSKRAFVGWPLAAIYIILSISKIGA